MVLFKDLYKPADSLFNRDWCHENCWETEHNWTHKSTGVDFKNKHFSTGADYKKTQNILETVYEGKCTDVTCKMDVVQSKVCLDVKAKDLLHKGLILGAKLDFKTSKSLTPSVELNSEFKCTRDPKHPCHSQLIFLPKTKALTLNSLWKGCCNTDVGGEIHIPNVSSPLEAPKVSIGVNKLRNGVNACFKYNHTFGSETSPTKGIATFAVHTCDFLNQKGMDVALIANYNVLLKNKDFGICTKYTINDRTWFKSKMNDDLKISAVLRHRFTNVSKDVDCFCGNFGISIDPKNKNFLDSARVGAKITFWS